MQKNNKCTNCGSSLLFNPKSGMLECMHCDTKVPVKTTQVPNEKKDYTLDYKPTLALKKATAYKCSTCGAQHSLVDGETLTRCPSCGNTSIGQTLDVVYQPDGIIPFKVNRSQAGEIFRKWIKTRKFAPNDLIEMAKMEKISGFYSPVWNMNYNVQCRYNATVTNVKVDDDGNETSYTTTVRNTLRSQHTDDVYSANKNVPDDFLKDLGDFDLDQLQRYSPEYMFGFSGTESNRDIHDVYKSIEEEYSLKNERLVRERLSSQYTRIDALDCRTVLNDVKFNYIYLPIWANHYTYKNKRYHCFINGSTGEVTGNSPKSFWKIFSIVATVVGAIAVAVLLLI